MRKCNYWSNSEMCEYCGLTTDDRLHWRSCHRVVSYFTYRTIVVIAMLCGLTIGGIMGYKYANYKQPCTEQTK